VRQNRITQADRLQRWLLSIALLLPVIAIGSSNVAPAEADDPVVVTGAGFGHGVGMSQWGAHQRALDGDTYDEILAAYFTGTTLEMYDDVVPENGSLFVNLEYDKTSFALIVRDTSRSLPEGGHAPMVVTRGDEVIELTTDEKASISWAAANDCTVEFLDQAGGSKASWDSGSCDMTFVWDGDSEQPTTKLEIEGCTLYDFGAYENQYKPCQYGRGVDIHTVDNDSHDKGWSGFDVILAIDIDDYVLGISEIGYTWPTQTLRAQAVAARSYAAASMDARLDPLSHPCGCQVYDTSKSQRYVGWGHVGNNRGQPDGIYTQTYWIAAALATDNEVLTHPAAPNNGVVSTVYSSSNGGASEAAHEKWGGSYKEYLSSVPDPQSVEPTGNPYRAWSCTASSSSIEDRILGSGQTLAAIEVTARNTSDSAKTVTVYPTTGDPVQVKSADFVSIVTWSCDPTRSSLPSRYFDVTYGTPPDPDPDPPEWTFDDIEGSVHRFDIEYLADRGAALSCDAGPDSFCPDDRMRREDVAAFIVRALDLPPTDVDYFTDDDDLPFEPEINALREAGITRGCNPPDNDNFCPDDTVTRGQTAAFLVRAWSLTDVGPGDWFVDDDESVFHIDIDRLMQAGITKGCNPPANDRYCPDRLLTRAEMSSFLARALQDLAAP
jgi:SpoIID/LytB domain protein